MPAMVSPVMVSPVAGAPVSALASADTGGGAHGVITAPGRAPAPAMVPEAGVAPVAGDGADRGGALQKCWAGRRGRERTPDRRGEAGSTAAHLITAPGRGAGQ